MTGDDALWTIAVSLGTGACVGGLLGALAALLWRARRESALRVEVETLRARLKTDDVVNVEREQSLDRARAQLQGVFGELARESLVQPIRDALAKTETQIRNIERDRIDAFATIRSQMEVLATGQTLLSRETRNLVTALRRPDVRGQWGEITLKRLVELSGMTAHVDFTGIALAGQDVLTDRRSRGGQAHPISTAIKERRRYSENGRASLRMRRSQVGPRSSQSKRTVARPWLRRGPTARVLTAAQGAALALACV